MDLAEATRMIVHRWLVQYEDAVTDSGGDIVEMTLETFKVSMIGLDLDLDELLDVANDVELITNQQFAFGVMAGVLFEMERHKANP